MQLQEKLISILATIHECFRPDELAYLAVTSKIENPLRDRIAFALHDQIGDCFLVHREWKDKYKKKADIAVTDMDNKVKCLIECKAHSAPTYERGYSDLIRGDMRKMYHTSEEATELYFIFFFNHLQSFRPIDRKFEYAIKYFHLLNNALKRRAYSPDMTSHVHQHWAQHLRDISLDSAKSNAIVIPAGSYHAMPVFIHAYLYGPFFKKDIKQLFD
jgi:hypothetical protein